MNRGKCEGFNRYYPLPAQIKDPDLWVGDTTVEPEKKNFIKSNSEKKTHAIAVLMHQFVELVFGTESTMKGAALLPNIPEYNLPPMNRNSGTTKALMGQGAWLGGLNVFVSRHLPTLGVGLVLAVAVALGRPPTHLGLLL